MKNIEREIPETGWQKKLPQIVFEADTPAGRAFDVTVIGLILLSLLAVVLESVKSVRDDYGKTLWGGRNGFSRFFLPSNIFCGSSAYVVPGAIF
jgi:voltage-gated potassium channel